jgi:hypothetical protein
MSTVIYASRKILPRLSSRELLFLFRRENATNGQTIDSSKASTSLSPKNEYYDIVVVGGGMVGTAMAKALGYLLLDLRNF